jgi:hypothetical protein
LTNLDISQPLVSGKESQHNFEREEKVSNFSTYSNTLKHKIESNSLQTNNTHTNNYMNNFIDYLKKVDKKEKEQQNFDSPVLKEKYNILDESGGGNYNSHNKSSSSQNTESSSFGNNLNINSNYFYYKLFDNFGEDLENSTMVYKNMFKVKLFKEETIEEDAMRFPKIKKFSEKEVNKKREDQVEDCFGPQKNKKIIKERQFKPY